MPTYNIYIDYVHLDCVMAIARGHFTVNINGRRDFGLWRDMPRSCALALDHFGGESWMHLSINVRGRSENDAQFGVRLRSR